MRKNIVVVFFLVGLINVGWAQSEAEATYLRKDTNLEIDLRANKLEISERYSADKIFYKNFDNHSRESVYYSDFDPIISLDAQTLIPDKSSFKKTKVSTIETKDIVQPGIFYGGYKRKDFVFPGLTSGSIGRLEYTKSIVDPHLLIPFYFDDDIPVKSAQYSVTFPKNMIVRFKLYGNQHDKIKFTEQALDDKIKYSWSLTEIPAYRKEENSPSRSFTAPHVVIFIDSYESRGNTIKVLSDVSDLYGWYSGLIKTMPVRSDEVSLRKEVTQLTQTCKSDEEKIRAIFQWTQKNIKYIAFEDGMAGFVPRTAMDVYTKRYGDCKDMANLLKSMINMAGIEAYLTWIGTRSKQYSYSDVPSAIADNHMICCVKLKDDFIFLDATNPYLKFGNPSSMIQGKEALIGINDSQFKVVKVPVLAMRENQQIDSLRINLEKDGVHGLFSGTLSGYKKDDIEVQHLKAAVTSDREYIRDFFTIGGNNISIENTVLKGLGDQNAPAKVSFKFVQPAYYKSLGEKIYLNMNFNKTLPGTKIDLAERNQLLESDYCFEHKTVVLFSLPPDYKPGVLPPDTEKKWTNFGISSRYIVRENTIVLEKLFYSNYLYLNTSDFPEWNDFIQVLTDINSQTVVIVKSK